MTDYETSFADLQRRLYDAEKELADLKQAVWGDIPASLIGTSLDGRIEALETTSVGALTAQGNPITVSGNETKDPQPELSVIDIEWGIPKTDPTSDSTATITLRPCEADGTEYDDADDVVVYLRNDRAEIQIEQRGWLATAGAVVGTILSFQRFPWDVGSPAVHGVLIGEGQDPRVAVSSADTVPGFLRYTAGDVQDHHKIVGDAEADADAATTGEWIECEIINAAGEEQLKIKHVGPGASCCCCAACLLTGIDIDAKGHVRQFRYDNGAGPYWTGII